MSDPALNEKPLWESHTAWIAAAGALAVKLGFNTLPPEKILWPFTLIILALIAQRFAADWGKNATIKRAKAEIKLAEMDAKAQEASRSAVNGFREPSPEPTPTTKARR